MTTCPRHLTGPSFQYIKLVKNASVVFHIHQSKYYKSLLKKCISKICVVFEVPGITSHLGHFLYIGYRALHLVDLLTASVVFPIFIKFDIISKTCNIILI